jgi:folate-binding protein YgfZ
MTHLFDLTLEGFLKITGNDAKTLLQGQFTCDLEKITPTMSTLSAFCNPQGRIISLFRLFMIGSDYYLQMPNDILGITLTKLKKYAVFYKVTLTNVSDDLQTLGLTGNITATANHWPSVQHEVITEEDVTIIKLSDQPTRYELIGSPAKIATLRKKLTAIATPSPEKHWKQININAGLPAIYAQTSEKFLPHDLQLNKLNAISFEKGCYTGQEIIARMQYLGKLKNQLFQAKATSKITPELGAPLYTESETHGYIVDYQSTDEDCFDLLIIAQAKDNPLSLFLDSDKQIALEIVRKF